MAGIMLLFSIYTGLILFPQPLHQPFVLNTPQQSEIANFLRELRPDPIMLASWMHESQLNPDTVSPTNDRGICQLSYRYNKKVIDDPRWKDRRWQAEQCVWKREHADHDLRMSYKYGCYLKYLSIFSK